MEHYFSLVLSVFYYPFVSIHRSTTLLLRGFRVDGECSNEDRHRYLEFKKEVENGIVIYNHPTFFDFLVLLKEFGYFRFVMTTSYKIPPISWIANRYKVLWTQPGSGTAAKIADTLRSRRKGDPLLSISPSAGKNTHEGYPEEYKTGAFLAKPVVLPVVIIYDPPEIWGSQSLGEMLKRRLRWNSPWMRYTLRVLHPIHPTLEEDALEFAKRCRGIVVDYMAGQPQVTSPTPSDASICFMTSHLFIAVAIYQVVVHANHIYASGMLWVFFTSFMFHSDPTSEIWRKIDIGSNLLLACGFGSLLLIERQYEPVACLVIAAIGYGIRRYHSFLVHIPITIGFFLII